MRKYLYLWHLKSPILTRIFALMFIIFIPACHSSGTVPQTAAQKENDLIRKLEKDNLMIAYCHYYLAWMQGIMSRRFDFGHSDSSRKKRESDLTRINDMRKHSGIANTTEYLYLIKQQHDLIKRIQLKYYHEFKSLTINERKAVIDSAFSHIIPHDSVNQLIDQANSYRYTHSLQ